MLKRKNITIENATYPQDCVIHQAKAFHTFQIETPKTIFSEPLKSHRINFSPAQLKFPTPPYAIYV
jgi:hypothetical protein